MVFADVEKNGALLFVKWRGLVFACGFLCGFCLFSFFAV